MPRLGVGEATTPTRAPPAPQQGQAPHGLSAAGGQNHVHAVGDTGCGLHADGRVHQAPADPKLCPFRLPSAKRLLSAGHPWLPGLSAAQRAVW